MDSSGTRNHPYKVIIVGGGPAAFSFIVECIRLDLIEEMSEGLNFF